MGPPEYQAAETADSPSPMRAGLRLPALVIGGLVGLCPAGCSHHVVPDIEPVTQVVTPAAAPTTQERLAKAEVARQAGEYKMALAIFRQILANNPTIATAYVGIGEIYLVQADYARAEPVLARAARLEPRNFDAQYGHARALQMLKRFVEAVKAYHRALTIQPQSVTANQRLATTYLQMGEPSSALVFAEKVVELDPANGPARANLGTIYLNIGRSTDAIPQYEAAVELMEPTVPLLKNLIEALAAAKRYVDAKNTTEFLIKLEPSAEAWERLGWCAFRMGDYQKSIEAYRESVRINPAYWPALNGVGCNALNTWLLSDKLNGAAFLEARQAFRQSLRVNPDQQKVISLLSRYGSG